MIFPKLTPARNGFSGIYEYEVAEEVPREPEPGVLTYIPPFFSYDGATIPWMGWQSIYTPYDPIVMAPALGHDWGYLTHLLSRERTDAILRTELIANGVPIGKANIIYDAVRMFGGSHWELRENDLNYISWLKQKLTNEGFDPARYALA